jgi:hypothetical protein
LSWMPTEAIKPYLFLSLAAFHLWWIHRLFCLPFST